MMVIRKHFIKVLELFSRKELSAIPDKHPEVLDKIFRPYMISGSSVAERTKILRDCYELLTKRNTNLLPMIFEPEGLEVFRICGGEYKIIIKSDGTFRKEGELAISIINATNNQRVYSCAFSFCEFENQYVQLIGAVQGPKKSEVNTSASLKYITKECFGLMPKNLVVKTAKIVANLYGVNTLFSIKSKSHIYQAKRYYSLKRKAKVIFDYDALWDEFKSLPLNDDLVEIKAYQKRDLDEIASKKGPCIENGTNY